MRIAALVYLPPRKLGSLEQWLLAFLAECGRRGHRVHLFCLTPMHPEVERRLHELGVAWTPFALLEQRPWRWGRILRESYDLVYMNLVVALSPGAYAGYFAWPIPVLYFDGVSGPMPGERGASWLGKLVSRALFRRVRALAGCSRYVVERDRRRFLMPARRCSVIHNGVDTTRFLPPAGFSGTTPGIGAVAYLIPEKGLDVLIEACARLLDLPWHLTVVGDGPELERLRALAGELGVAPRVRFLGLRDDVEAVLRTVEIYVHPCRWEEAFGLTIAEAMASGCAIVASRAGGIPELLEDGECGLLVERGDVAGFAEALRGLLTDPARRRGLGARARTRAVARFGLRTAVDAQVDWIERWGPRDSSRAGNPAAHATRGEP